MTEPDYRPIEWFQPVPSLYDVEDRALAADIREHGLFVPVVATPVGEIVDGRRRFLAAQAAGLTEIPVRIVEATLVDLQGMQPEDVEGGTVSDGFRCVGTLQGVHVEEDGTISGYIDPGGERVVIREPPIQGPPCPRPALAQEPLRLDRLDEVKARCANHKAILEENRAQRDPESVYLPCTCALCTDLPAALETIGRLAAVVQAAVGEYDKETLGTGLKHPVELVGLMVELYKARRLLKELGG